MVKLIPTNVFYVIVAVLLGKKLFEIIVATLLWQSAVEWASAVSLSLSKFKKTPFAL